MGIDVDAEPFGIFQKFAQIAQVVTGNEDSGIFADTGFHSGDLRVTVCGGIGPVKQFHCADRGPTALEHHGGQLFHGTGTYGRHQCPADEGVDRAVFVTEHCRMIGIGAQPFEAIEKQFLEGTFVRIGFAEYTDRGEQAFRVQSPGTALGTSDEFIDSGRIEVGVGDGCEQSLNHEESQFRIRRVMPVIQKQGDSFELRDQPIHLVGGFRRFAADAAHGAAGISAGLLTLETEHLFIHTAFLLGLGQKCNSCLLYHDAEKRILQGTITVFSVFSLFHTGKGFFMSVREEKSRKGGRSGRTGVAASF